MCMKYFKILKKSFKWKWVLETRVMSRGRLQPPTLHAGGEREGAEGGKGGPQRFFRSLSQRVGSSMKPKKRVERLWMSLRENRICGEFYFCSCLCQVNPFLPTVQTFAVRETSVSRTANVWTMGKNGLTWQRHEQK